MTAMGHKQTSRRHLADVRFTPENGHREFGWVSPLCAKSGLMHCSKISAYSIISSLPSAVTASAKILMRIRSVFTCICEIV